MASAAKFFAKIYNKTGATFRRTLDSSLLLSVPMIIRETNKLASDLTIDVALPWDNFGYGQANGINLYDLVKLYAANPNQPAGYLVFTGFVTDIHALFDKGQNHIALRLMPLDSILDNAFYRSGGNFTISFAGADVNAIMSAAVGDCNTVQGTTYFTTSLAAPGKSITVDLVLMKHLEAINKAASFLDLNWYWRIEPNGLFKLAQYNDMTATHRLTLGLDVDSIDVQQSIFDVKNGTVVSWGPTPTNTFYSDAGSQTAYGKREEKIIDSNIKDLTSSDSAGNGNVSRKKNARAKAVITVNSNYAIETILPGDTIRILNNTSGASQLISGVQRVSRVEYDGSLAKLHLADSVDVLGLEFTRALGTVTQL